MNLTSLLLDYVKKEASDCFKDINICDNFHLSISKTFCVKKHKIEQISQSVEKKFGSIPKYVNENCKFVDL